MQLKIQYGKDVQESNTSIAGVPKRLLIPKWMLAQDFTMTIAGAWRPARQADARTGDAVALRFVDEESDHRAGPGEDLGVTRMLLEEYNRADVLALIGTRDEAQQQKQVQQMMQRAQMMGMGGAQLGGQGGQPGEQGGGGQPQQPQISGGAGS